MGGWSDTTRQREWSGRSRARSATGTAARWTGLDVFALVICFWAHWELGIAFLGLKLWHQASGFEGSVFSFARLKWDALVRLTQGVFAGRAMPFSLHVGPIHVGRASSGNRAFDAWRETELSRIEAERVKLRSAERAFVDYHDELLQAKDREDFDRFMRARTVEGAPAAHPQ